ncbi:MAG: hypothetical protein KDC87_08035 [Planctomycetes bacterium]|nr:hypothetical protein [Planctomycetota bacterium]MCB9871961.1 hypothetical protein [Planctomycetota bacterium]MCB9889540.1 hypothetical protein [Planctomycetota bacterium]
MLGRYRIVRGKRPPGDPLPVGTRQDTRKHTRHILRPDAAAVAAYLAAPSERAWQQFADDYRQTLARRYAGDRAPFDAIADQARTDDVWLGCNCPTDKNPRVDHCHTYLALQFFAARYPALEVRMPD